jgi:hypothetical protein
LISWSLQLLRILKKQQQGKAIRKKEKRPYLDENDSLMHGRTVTAPQQIASGFIKQARSVENLQGLSRDRLSFFRSTCEYFVFQRLKLLEKKFRETSQNFNSFSSFRQFLFTFFYLLFD